MGYSFHTHGHARGGKTTPTYRSWKCMMDRCYLKSCNSYPYYGGRGVIVYPQWHTFAGFLADMGERPPGKTIDRFPDSHGDYRPHNCRWATPHEQAVNRKSTHFIEHNGTVMTISDWDAKNGFYPGTVYQRLRRGWTESDAVSTPRIEDHR